MKRLIVAACAALTLGAAGAAFADGQVNATLEQPQSGHLQLIAGGAVFRCAETSCVAGYGPDEAGSVSGCKDLARKVGPLSYYAQTRPLDGKELAKCNAVAAGPRPATTASR
jgi:hypothetical protein